ncbi:MAG: hypothetical protein RLY20_2333 [Verrucomicrobiota bacterium]
MTVFEFWHWPLLFLAGLAAGFVDSIAGGGGLITLPVLVGFGLDPRLALGTNKLQGTFGSASATWHYAESGTMPLRDCLIGFICTFIGSVIGAAVVQVIHPDMLRKIIPVMLAAIAVFVWLKPKLGETDLHPRMPRRVFDVTFGLGLGFYDGFFGPGTGTFWAIAFVVMVGFNLTKATGYTKAMNFASNLGSLLFFLAAGQVLYLAGLTMGVGQLLGARIGARMVVSRGTSFVRPVLLTAVFAIIAKLIYDAYFRAH